jgi:hypothetical protein
MFPDEFDVVPGKRSVGRHQRHAFDLCMNDQEAVEGLFVMERKMPYGLDMLDLDRQERVAGYCQGVGDFVDGHRFAHRDLDRDFPDRCDAYVERDIGRKITEESSRHAMRLAPRPQDYVGVDEIAISHLMYSSHSGPSSSQSSDMKNGLSVKAPTRGSLPAFGLSGPILAYGLPCLVTVISSPAAALRRISERLAFISATVTFIARSIIYGHNLHDSGHNSACREVPA